MGLFNEEQIEAHRKAFLDYWYDVCIPAFLDSGIYDADGYEAKEQAWESWIIDAEIDYLAARKIPPFYDGPLT